MNFIDILKTQAPGAAFRHCRFVCAIAVLTSALAAANAAEPAGGLNDALRPCGLKTAGDFRVESDFKRSSGGTAYDTIVASNDTLRVEIELVRPVSRQRAANYAKSKYTVLKSLYDAQRSPYPGQITNKEECPPERKPVGVTMTILGQPTPVLLANATERHTFGVWQDDLIKTRGAFCVVYDEISRSILEFRVFQSSASFRPETVAGFLESLARL